MANNKDLTKANKQKKDEFYTQLSDIEKELKHYREHFKGKTIFCNCDDPIESNFWKYFELNFTQLGLKKLVATHYETSKPSYKLEIVKDENGDGLITSKDIIKTTLKQNGDFRSPECIKILKESDIIITNPPFSLFREFVAQLIEYDKKFIIIGNINGVTYKEIFPLIRDNKVWLGQSIHSGDREFRVPDDYPLNAAGSRIDSYGTKYIRVKGIRWITNLDFIERHENLLLYKKYTPEEYPEFDNYKVINVDKTSDIPCDYKGAMGVPITFLDKYNPEQFTILNANDYRKNDKVPIKPHGLIKDKDGSINGKPKYARIVIMFKEDSNGN